MRGEGFLLFSSPLFYLGAFLSAAVSRLCRMLLRDYFSLIKRISHFSCCLFLFSPQLNCSNAGCFLEEKKKRRYQPFCSSSSSSSISSKLYITRCSCPFPCSYFSLPLTSNFSFGKWTNSLISRSAACELRVEQFFSATVTNFVGKFIGILVSQIV